MAIGDQIAPKISIHWSVGGRYTRFSIWDSGENVIIERGYCGLMKSVQRLRILPTILEWSIEVPIYCP